MNTDFNIGSIGNVALNRATASKHDSIASLASGKKQNLSRKDPGAFSLSQRLQVQSVSNQGAKVAIQNAMSIAHTQEEALNRMSKLLTKMNELAEGLAEFIRGADNRANASKNSLGTAALVQLPGDGWNGGSDDYAGAYLAVKYLDNQIRSSGATAVNGVNASDGVKHLTTWMKVQRDANAGASASGLNQYIETHLNGAHGYGVGNSTDTSGQAIDDFLADFEGANGQAFVNGLNLTDTDTGSVHGSEYGGAVKSTADVVRDDAAYLTGFNSQLTFEEEEVEDPVPIELSGGTAITLSAVNPVSFGDTSTYNLETENGAKLVMERVDELIGIITNSLSQVGSNMGMIERGAQMINSRDSAMVSAVSRVSDVSMPEEALNLARSEILINSNINMRVQARNIQQDVMLTMLG